MATVISAWIVLRKSSEMASQLNVNYKTALKLCRKCRVLMTLSNSEKILDSMYYEADTIYIGAKTEEKPRNGY